MNKFQKFAKAVDAHFGTSFFDGTETEDEATAKIEAQSKQNGDKLADLEQKVETLATSAGKLESTETALATINTEVAKIATLETTIAELKTTNEANATLITDMKASIKNLQLAAVPAAPAATNTIQTTPVTETITADEIVQAQSKYSPKK